MKKIFSLLCVGLLLIISGCNGSSGDNETTPDPAEVTTLSLTVTDENGNSQNSFSIDDTVTLVAVVSDQYGKVMVNQQVSYSTDIGSLPISSDLTDSNGTASVELQNTNAILGVATVIASAGEITSQAQFKFVNEQPVLTTIITLNGNEVSEFNADESIEISTTVLDKNLSPLTGAEVSFSATLGTLSLPTATTNNEGVASVSLTSNNETTGDGVISVMLTNDSSTAQQVNYTINPAVLVASSLVISLTDDQGNSKVSFNGNENINILAQLQDQFGGALTEQRINFSTDLGVLSVPSSITNTEGFAKTIVTNENLTASAGSISATYEALTSQIDFEYLDNSLIEVLPTLTAKILLGGNVTNRFKADEQAQIQVTMLDTSGNPIANKIVDFTADVGLLVASSTLTDDTGVATTTLSGNGEIGAGVITATSKENSLVNTRVNYEIVAADAIIDDEVRLGYFDNDNTFIEGSIKISTASNSISAGGTIGLSVDLVDNSNQRITTPTPVTFTSNCVGNGNANIDETVFSINGIAQATFEDVDCAGTAGTQDIIVASVTANNITNTANTTINIEGENLGSIEFVSAEPTNIVIKGTGGQGRQETSTITFTVKSELGNVVAQQEVLFTLDSEIGGITLSRSSGLTNSQGIVTTQVTAGTVPTTVRVTAQAQLGNKTIQTQSDLLSINTGLPEQRSFTIAASVLNPEADINGTTSIITAWLADNYNNPVVDGTTINFTTEGGVIDGSCTTIGGSCFVEWRSTEPRLEDHRSTILATAIGHESFFDTNGNNVFDDEDGIAIADSGVSSGFKRRFAEASGFIDMSEAWRDDNENEQHDPEETQFYDYDGNGVFSFRDEIYNGPQLCTGDECSTQQAIHLRKALVLVMASSQARYILLDSTNNTIYANSEGASSSLPDLPDGNGLALTFSFADTSLQTLALGSTIAVTIDGGEVAGEISATVDNNNQAGYQSMNFIVSNPLGGDGDEIATVTLTITSPSGVVTSVIKTLTMLAP